MTTYDSRRRNAIKNFRDHRAELDNLNHRLLNPLVRALGRVGAMVDAAEARFVDGGHLPVPELDEKALLELRCDLYAVIAACSLLSDFAGYSDTYDDVRSWGYERLGAVDRTLEDRSGA